MNPAPPVTRIRFGLVTLGIDSPNGRRTNHRAIVGNLYVTAREGYSFRVPARRGRLPFLSNRSSTGRFVVHRSDAAAVGRPTSRLAGGMSLLKRIARRAK